MPKYPNMTWHEGPWGSRVEWIQRTRHTVEMHVYCQYCECEISDEERMRCPSLTCQTMQILAGQTFNSLPMFGDTASGMVRSQHIALAVSTLKRRAMRYQASKQNVDT